MARGKKRIGLEAVRRQIEEAEAEVVKAKRKYDEATDNLKSLLDLEKAVQAEELMDAIAVSAHSYEDILRFIKSEPETE